MGGGDAAGTSAANTCIDGAAPRLRFTAAKPCGVCKPVLLAHGRGGPGTGPPHAVGAHLSAVVALIVLMAGCGTAIALLGPKVSFSGGITTDVPSPDSRRITEPDCLPYWCPGSDGLEQWRNGSGAFGMGGHGQVTRDDHACGSKRPWCDSCRQRSFKPKGDRTTAEGHS